MTNSMQFKIFLTDSDPLIWRRVLIPNHLKFSSLHKVIQALFDWADYHLYEFSCGKPFRSEKIAKTKCLEDYFYRARQKAFYLYDFGDSWEHAIVFEKRSDEKLTHPICLEGANSAPPEDSGGLWGYYGMLEAVTDPKHPEHEQYIEWLSEDFDPKHFDIDDINKRLKRIKGRRKRLAA